jgi:hypothetical protein
MSFSSYSSALWRSVHKIDAPKPPPPHTLVIRNSYTCMLAECNCEKIVMKLMTDVLIATETRTVIHQNKQKKNHILRMEMSVVCCLYTRSQWQRGLRRRSAAAWLLGSRD